MTNIDKSSIQEYVEESQDIIESFPQMDEQNTKRKLIEPLLKQLGWDIMFDVELEYSIRMGRNKKNIDYALMTDEDTPSVLVEAKGLYKSLSDEDSEQLESYMRVASVEWGLLTNGEDHILKRLKSTKDGSKLKTIRKIHTSNLNKNIEVLDLISKDSIVSGESSQKANQFSKRKEANEKLKENKEEISNELIKLIRKHTNDSVTQIADKRSKEMIDKISNDLSESDKDSSKRGNKNSSERNENIDSIYSKIENNTGIKFENGDPIFDDEGTIVSQFIQFIEILLSEDYIDDSDIPIERGETRYLINHKPIHKNGNDMYRPKKLTNGLYIETNNNTDTKKNIIKNLISRLND
jgi:hypothetical protein